MTRTGFTFVELLIALALSGLIASGIFVAFYQINNLKRTAEHAMILDRAVILIKNTLEKDLTGLFIPQSYIDEHAAQSSEKKDGEKKKTTTVFSAQVKDKQLLELSCISTHNIQIATPERSLEPYIVRVWYFLELADKEKGWYTLRRLQTHDLSATKEDIKKKDMTGDIVAERITTFSIQCWYIKKEEKNDAVTQTSGWQSKNKELPPAPTWIDIECTVASPDALRSSSLRFSCHLFGAAVYQEMNKKNAQKKQDQSAQPKKELPKNESQSIVQNKDSANAATTAKPAGIKNNNKP